MSNEDKIDPSILTGQGLPDSNPFKDEDEGEEEDSSGTSSGKSRSTRKDIDRADYVAELENYEDDEDESSDSDEEELYL